MSQDDTIGKIELNQVSSCQVTILIARMTFNSGLQLFDEHRVNGDYH